MKPSKKKTPSIFSLDKIRITRKCSTAVARFVLITLIRWEAPDYDLPIDVARKRDRMNLLLDAKENIFYFFVICIIIS